MTNLQVNGVVSPGFEPVRKVFEENFAQHREVGAAVSVFHDGRPVVDLWGGWADQRHNKPWAEDTLGLLLSATKGLTTICALHLADQGLLDVEAPVAKYWPEFAANGKEKVTVRHLMTHQAGLVGFSHLKTIADIKAWDPLIEDLAAQKPAWEPGTAHGYHAYTYGWLVGEVVRRISGLTPGKYLHEKICKPLNLDIWMGLPPSERHRYARVEQDFHPLPEEEKRDAKEFTDDLLRIAPPMAKSRLSQTPWLQKYTARMAQGGFMREFMGKSYNQLVETRELSDSQRAFLTLYITIADMATDQLLDMEVPAGNGICTARSLARLYATLIGEVDGKKRLLSPEITKMAATLNSSGRDRVMLTTTTFGLGFMVPGCLLSEGWGEGAFGHPGNGGSVGFADPNCNMSFGYTLKTVNPSSRYPRVERLLKAVYDCL
jgi:CubicO group peptidase (beta-lactamase class C family)